MNNLKPHGYYIKGKINFFFVLSLNPEKVEYIFTCALDL